MKKLFFYSLVIGSLNVYGQYPEFAPVGATWYYNQYQLNGDLHVRKITSIADTSFLGHTCKKFHSESDPGFYAYRDSLKIYLSYVTDTAWYLLYDFSKNVDDTFYVGPAFAPDSIPIKVLVKGDTIINGFILPYMIIESLDAFWYWNGKAILNIGSDVYFVPPFPLNEPSTSGLRCYEDSIIGEYHLVEPCDTTIYLGTESVITGNEFMINPNPANDQFTASTFQSGFLTVTDQLGTILQTFSIKNQQIIISTKNLQAGIYLVTFQTDKSHETKKIIIQH